MCHYAYEYKGYRSSGGNLPGYAQGAYFPGDEPDVYCSMTGKPCTHDRYPATPCAAAQPSPWLCPGCRELGAETPLLLWQAHQYRCPVCEEVWDEAKLARRYAELISTLYADYEREADQAGKLLRECAGLRQKIERLQTALDE